MQAKNNRKKSNQFKLNNFFVFPRKRATLSLKYAHLRAFFFFFFFV